jgi:hypothetical protein
MRSIISILSSLTLCVQLYSQDSDVFKNFKQILQRGSIVAVVNPTYVSAEDADISDDSWVLGIVMSGQARAYSLNLLNHHEIVNEVIEGGKAFNLGDIKIFLYRPDGAELFYSTIAYKTTGTGFSLTDGQWIDGDSNCIFDFKDAVFLNGKGSCPERLNGYDTFWYTWSLTNPDTKLWE